MRQVWLCVLACWVALGGAARAQVDPDSLAIQARSILRAHCASCHGPGPNAKAGLRLDDRALLVEKRKLLQPGGAAASELLDLVAGGSMPPGDRPRVSPKEVEILRQWIDAGVPTPPQPGDDYVLRRIVRDWKQGKIPGDRRAVRYLSLNHLLRGNQAAEQLDAARKDLEQALATFGRGPAKLEAIDPENSVFRVVLTDLGWDTRPFGEHDLGDDDKRVGPARLSLYDLVLLEYPYGYLTFSSPAFADLARMLRQTKAIRPIPYVRGDWLTAVLTGSPLGGEIAAALERESPKVVESPYFGGKVSLEDAAAELGWKKGLPELQKALGEAKLDELGRGAAIARPVWELAFPRVVERLGLGKAIAPLDALGVPNYRGDTDVDVRIVTADEKGKPKKQFVLKQLLQVQLRPSRKAAVELINTAVKGKVYPLLAPAGELAADEIKKLPDNQPGFTIYDDPGTETLTAFAVAYDDHLPGGLDSFPKGQLFRAAKVKGLRDRFVHQDLYSLRADDKGFNSPVAANVVKVTVGFEITKR